MEEKELKTLTDGINAKMGEIQKSIESNSENATNASKEVHDLKEQLKTLPQKDYVEKMQTQLDNIEGNIKSLNQKVISNAEPVNDIKAALESEEFIAKSKEPGFKYSFQTKTSITTANSFTETNSKIIPSHRDMRIGGDPMAALPVQQLVNRLSLGDSDYVDWFERTSETDSTGWKAEAATSVEGSLGWTSYKVPVEDVKTHMTVSRRKLADTNWMMSQIQSRLLYQMNAQVEDNILDGTGSSNQLFGLIGASYAKTFNAPTVFETNVPFANYADVLEVAAAQIGIGNSGSNALSGGFNCTAHVVSPADYHFMKMLKDERGLPLQGFSMENGQLSAWGIPVFKSFFITAGTFLSGDFTKSSLWQRQGITLEIWDQTASNALTGLVTVLATGRFALETQVADRFGFVTGTFTTGLSEIAEGGQ